MNRSRLNPFGTGQCLSTYYQGEQEMMSNSLNPFGTGQCLSTDFDKLEHACNVSIPLEQGNVFRLCISR